MGTFLQPLYVDFGVLGIVFFPAVFGGIVSLFYILFRCRRDMLGLVWYSIMGMTALWAFWGFDLFETRHLWYMFVVFLMSRLVKGISRKSERAHQPRLVSAGQ